MSKHTPGPWRFDKNNEALVGGDGSYVISLLHSDLTAEMDMYPEDAALIAAAPMQHDALKLAEQYLAKRVGHLPTSEGYKVLAAIREAIARATGES